MFSLLAMPLVGPSSMGVPPGRGSRPHVSWHHDGSAMFCSLGVQNHSFSVSDLVLILLTLVPTNSR